MYECKVSQNIRRQLEDEDRCMSTLPEMRRSGFGKEEWLPFLDLRLTSGQLGTVLHRSEVVDVGGLQEVGERQKKRLV